MKITINIITYICILFITSIVTKTIYKKQARETEQYVFNMIIFSRIFLIGAVIFMIILCIVNAFPNNLIGREKILGILISIVFIIVLFSISFLFTRWHIDLQEEKIEYCSMFGKKKVISYDTILRAEIDERDILHIYYGDNEEIIFPTGFGVGQNYIIEKLKSYKIVAKYKCSVNNFSMKLPLLYPIMHGGCTIISLVCVVVSLKLKMSIGIATGIVMTVCSIYALLSDIIGKIVVTKGIIYQYRFLRKTKKLKLSEVERVERREKDSVEYIYLYSKQGMKIKISMLCKNANLFEKVVRQIKK